MTSAFESLRKYVEVGQVITLTVKSDNAVSVLDSSLVMDLHPNGIVIKTDNLVRFIADMEIVSWSVNHDDNAELPERNKLGNLDSDLGNTEENEIQLPESDGSNAADMDLSYQEVELVFIGTPSINHPEPCFDIDIVSEGIRKEIVRWRNRFANAKKIHEPARVGQDVSHIIELAESLGIAELYYIAGYFSYISGLGIGKAKNYYQCAADYGYSQANQALAFLAIQSNDWQEASNRLLRILLLDELVENRFDLLLALGQCIQKTEDKKLAGLGQAMNLNLNQSESFLLSKIIALTLPGDQQAFNLALSNDKIQLSKLDSSSSLFEKPDLGIINSIIEDIPEMSENQVRRQGKVSVYYPERNFGFLVEDATGQIWFFHYSVIDDDDLFKSLMRGQAKQIVKFTGNTEIVSGRYPNVTKVVLVSSDDSKEQVGQGRAPLKVRLSGVPKDGSSYSKAKKSEQLDQLIEAEQYYLEEISNNGRHKKSAIKDLAALYNRINESEKATKFLDDYRDLYTDIESVSLDQMKVQFLVKLKRYSDAALLLSLLAKKEPKRAKKRELNKQEAYCYFANREFDRAIAIFENIVRLNPQDEATRQLLAKVKSAKEMGEDEFQNLFHGDESLASLTSGISKLARSHLNKCEFSGVDERTREKNEYEERDFKQVERLLASIKGRRPSDQANYLLTLAALCEKVPSLSAEKNIYRYLRRYFERVSEAAMSDRLDRDIIRCYSMESLRHHPTEAKDQLESAWVLLLGTYFSDMPEPSMILIKDGQERSKQLFDRLKNEAEAWESFQSDAPHFRMRFPTAFAELERHMSIHDLNLVLDLRKENEIMNFVESSFHSITLTSISGDYLSRVIDTLSKLPPIVHFQLDRERLQEAINVTRDCIDYASERHFREKETKFLKLEATINRICSAIDQGPTHLSYEKISPLLSELLKSITADFQKLCATKPIITIKNVLDKDFYALVNGSVALRILLVSTNEIAPGVESIDVIESSGIGEPCHSPEPLHGGQRREVELIIKPTEKQISDGVFSVNIIIQYRDKGGNIEKLDPLPLPVRLGEFKFEKIQNPYERYAGGSPVEEESMFFGRSQLVEKISSLLNSGTLGQCFVLYGQKRSGKSSVLYQVEKRTLKNNLFIKLSAGTFNDANIWASFTVILLQELAFKLEDMKVNLPDDWPQKAESESQPIASIKRCTRAITKLGYRLIIAIDEFSYVFENDNALSFMRGWKALLEQKAFNALLVGQDTMPRFKQAFPNEFGITHDERISYLNYEEAAKLAEEPILLEGKSRYRGQALERLYKLTAGSPYYMQIACDRLVNYLNSREAPFVTEADIEIVKQQIAIGEDALSRERFDALVTAAGEKVALIPRTDLWNILSRIARESLHSGWCYQSALTDLPNYQVAIRDLADREVLLSEGDRLSIRVDLFASWLRANQL